MKLRTIAALCAVPLLAACTDPDGARRALDDMAFSNVEIRGYAWMGCGEDYIFHTRFQAVNLNGKTVTGVVCSTWLKGKSVKFD